MVGQIGPLVQVGRKKTALAFHVLGGVVGGAAIGVVLGFTGLLLRAAIGDTLDTVFVVVVPAALLSAAAVDLGVLPVRPITWERQTPGSWPCSMGHYPGIFAWGFDLGLAVSTRVPYQPLLVLPLAAVLVGNLPAAVAITGVYGAAKAIAVVVAISSTETDYPGVCNVIQTNIKMLRRAVGAAALAVAVVIVVF